MRSAITFGKKITSWELLSGNLKPLLGTMPFLEPIQAELEALIVEARTLDQQQELARGQARELTRKRQDAEKLGENLRRRISAHLRGQFGFTSELLVQFGVNPRPRLIRRKKEPEEVPAPAAAPSPAQ
jgi:hypothetical protein